MKKEGGLYISFGNETTIKEYFDVVVMIITIIEITFKYFENFSL